MFRFVVASLNWSVCHICFHRVCDVVRNNSLAVTIAVFVCVFAFTYSCMGIHVMARITLIYMMHCGLIAIFPEFIPIH